mmetsp:Transcript_28851/g.37921  ORF Transcript_28851/g.37921 Transcript_28851/m.37921 type:complete len:201 (+) Transcript_28851:539-1141(+)
MNRQKESKASTTEKKIASLAQLANVPVPPKGQYVQPLDCARNLSCKMILEAHSYGAIYSFLPTEHRGWDASYDKAKAAIDVLETEYMLVIPLEAMREGLKLLECMLPHYFSTASANWRKMFPKNVSPNSHSVAKDGEDQELFKVTNSTGEEKLYKAAVLRFCAILHFVKDNEADICPLPFELGIQIPAICENSYSQKHAQ